MSDHSWCLGIRVCGDKINCPQQQTNGGCIQIAPERKGSKAIGPSTAISRQSENASVQACMQ